MAASVVFTDLDAATMAPDREGYGLVRGAVIAVREGLVAWIGSEADRGRAP